MSTLNPSIICTSILCMLEREVGEHELGKVFNFLKMVVGCVH